MGSCKAEVELDPALVKSKINKLLVTQPNFAEAHL